MPIWLVKATWIEDEIEASEQWEVNAATAHDAVKEATTYIVFIHITSKQNCACRRKRLAGKTSDRVRRGDTSRHSDSGHEDGVFAIRFVSMLASTWWL